MSMNLYEERDVEELDEVHNLYCKHVNAMTTEGLHSKSAIAAELAWRDWKILQLERRGDVRVQFTLHEGVIVDSLVTSDVSLLRVPSSEERTPTPIAIVNNASEWLPGDKALGTANLLFSTKNEQVYTYTFNDPEFKPEGVLPPPQMHYIGNVPSVDAQGGLRKTIYAISLT